LELLSRFGATVDKFVGDSVLAYWTLVTEKNLFNAAQSARALLDACQAIQQKYQDRFAPLGRGFSSGVGLHTGKVAYGNMSQRESTLIGDSVNLTFRVEAMTRILGCNALASSEFLAAAPALRGCCQNLGVHQLKGRNEPVEIWGFIRFPE